MTELNTSGIEPLAYHVLVRMEKLAEKTQGGVFLPEQMKEREERAQSRGVVVAIGHGTWDFMSPRPPEEHLPAVGDTVVFPRYSGMELKEEMVDDDNIFRMIEDKSLCGWRKARPVAVAKEPVRLSFEDAKPAKKAPAKRKRASKAKEVAA